MEEQIYIANENDCTSNNLLFDGITFTTTDLSPEEKLRVNDMIAIMGGKIKNDLTSNTNILIVGNINTPKTKYCLKYRTDVTLLYPDDLNDIFKRFKEKHIPPLTIQILDDYPWPIFNSCLFCLSRLRDVDNPCYEKTYITKLIEHFGGKSIASLTPKVTYLITDKREGKRYESAIDWNINAIHPKWIIDCCKCQRILNPALYDISTIENPSQIGLNAYKKYRNVIDYGSTKNNPFYSKLQKSINKLDSTSKENQKLKNNGLFKGFIFSYFGFTKEQSFKLIKVLKENGAEIQDEYDSSVTHVILPSFFTYNNIPEKILKLDDITDSKKVNEWFIERCLYYNKICNDSWSIIPKYLHSDYKLKIHITGFVGIEYLHITKLINYLNLTLEPQLTQNCDFLVANLASLGLNKLNSPQLFKYKFSDILDSKTDTKASSASLTKRKINSAKKWNIPVVSLSYIWELSQKGVLPPVIDAQWCIFAPRSLKPASNFLEYARSLTGPSFHNDLDLSEGKSDNNGTEEEMQNINNGNDKDGNVGIPGGDSFSRIPVPLPSPRKNSTKKWPKIVGTASESQLKSLTSDNMNFNEDHDENDSEYNFRGKRKLMFGNLDDENIKKPLKFLEFDDDFEIEDIPVFKKRRK